MTVTLPRTVDDACAAERRGDPVRYLCFWGHQPQRDGRVGPGCLSQWWPAPFTVDGVTYATAEHWMMAGKARLFRETELVEQIVAATHPNDAKTLGRQVRGFNETRWAEHRYPLVVAGSVAKFGQHPDLRAFLLGTEGQVLVEASPVDRIWGIGLAASDPAARQPSQWRGLNLLGFALMDARDELANWRA